MQTSYEFVVDVMRVPVRGDPNQAVRSVQIPAEIHEVPCGIAVLGGGTGGTAAALAAGRSGLDVVLVEETDWLGGQFTSQGVSALDEHQYIESFGGTASYYELRDRIRKAVFGLEDLSLATTPLNPGSCWVSSLAFTPKIGVEVIDDMMKPYVSSQAIRVLKRTKLVAASVEADTVTDVTVMNLDDGSFLRLLPQIVIDATEFGDLLPLLCREFRVGAESVHETHEPSAQPHDNRQGCSQGITYVFTCERRPGGEAHVLQTPDRYEQNRDTQPFSFTIDVHGGEIYGDTSGLLTYRLYERMPGTKGGVWTYVNGQSEIPVGDQLMSLSADT